MKIHFVPIETDDGESASITKVVEWEDYAALQASHAEMVDALYRAVTEMKFWAEGHADAEIFIAEKALANAAKLAPTKADGKQAQS